MKKEEINFLNCNQGDWFRRSDWVLNSFYYEGQFESYDSASGIVTLSRLANVPEDKLEGIPLERKWIEGIPEIRNYNYDECHFKIEFTDVWQQKHAYYFEIPGKRIIYDESSVKPYPYDHEVFKFDFVHKLQQFYQKIAGRPITLIPQKHPIQEFLDKEQKKNQ